MEKTYKKPEKIVENFDVEDFITESGLEGRRSNMEQRLGGLQNLRPW